MLPQKSGGNGPFKSELIIWNGLKSVGWVRFRPEGCRVALYKAHILHEHSTYRRLDTNPNSPCLPISSVVSLLTWQKILWISSWLSTTTSNLSGSRAVLPVVPAEDAAAIGDWSGLLHFSQYKPSRSTRSTRLQVGVNIRPPSTSNSNLKRCLVKPERLIRLLGAESIRWAFLIWIPTALPSSVSISMVYSPAVDGADLFPAISTMR